MKFLIHYYMFSIVVFTISSGSAAAQSLTRVNTMHITAPQKGTFYNHLEKYLLNTYQQLGYEVVFERILVGRAREMVNKGVLDAHLVAEKEIEKVDKNLLRVPVLLVKGILMLYCAKEVSCDLDVLNDATKVIGVVSGNSISANYMKKKQAALYTMKGEVELGNMLTKNRLSYILIVNENKLGIIKNFNNFDGSQYNKIEVYRSEGFHYIHKKHINLVPSITQALQLAIEELGPLY